MITGLDHIHIVCRNLEEGVKYFERMFDGKEVARGEYKGTPLVRVDVKGTIIGIMGTDPKAGRLEPGKGSAGLDHFGFKVNNMDQTAAELKKKGAKFTVGPDQTPAGLKFAFLEGPEGVRIELVEKD
jgi:lactoylglutathione lyase